MSTASKITCMILSAISLLFIAKYLELGSCIRYSRETRKKTNIQIGRTVTMLREERDEEIAEIHNQIKQLKANQAPCEVEGFEIIPE
jgi:hypothetical protein